MEYSLSMSKNEMLKLISKWIEFKKNHAECGKPDSEREVYYDFF